MNQKLIISLLLIALIGNIACRKYNQGYTPINPSREKKWTVTTIAGDGRPFFADGPVLSASFRNPLDVAVAEDGTIYVADPLSNRIRSTAGYQDGDAMSAKFSSPGGLGIDKQGNIYVADINNHRIRKISFE